MSDTVRYYFSLRSPYSWLACEQLVESGVQVDPVPIVRFAEGVEFGDPTAQAAKRKYVGQDVARLAILNGLKITLPDPFDLDWARVHRPFQVAKEAGKGMDYVLAAYRARWSEGRKIDEPEVVREIAESIGVDGDAAVAALDDASLSDRMLAEYGPEIDADHVFGVPFMVHQGEPFWGQDRAALLIAKLRGEPPYSAA